MPSSLDMGTTSSSAPPLEEVERTLRANEPGPGCDLGSCGSFPQLRHREVATNHLADLSGIYELAQRAERLGDGHRRGGIVHLVQVDAVSLQPAQARLDRQAGPPSAVATPLVVTVRASTE